MALGIFGPRGNLAKLFSQKRGTSFPSVDNLGMSSSLLRRQFCDSDTVSVRLLPCGTVMCPEALFPALKSQRIICSPISHSCPFHS